MSNTNIILNTDSYKLSHWRQYPPKTEYVRSYIEARGGIYNDVVFFGLQAFLKEYLCKPVTETMLSEAASILDLHGVTWNRAGWEYIIDQHDGYLPIAISAVKEGTIVPTGNVLVQAINTDPECYWLTSYIEPPLLRGVWAPSTVATLSKLINTNIRYFLEETGCANVDEQIPFKLHDFGFRGAESYESGCLNGAAHLVNFMGTDTLGALETVKKYYGNPCAGFSIDASEHSSIISWGRENEALAYENMLDQFLHKDKIVACVSDSYDIMEALDMWYSLEDKIRGSDGTLVIRPDSGEPVQMTYDVITRLMDLFGYTVNEMGYKVLPDCLRVIYGDGINKDTILKILANLYNNKIAAENIAFGMGGALSNGSTRDDLSWAMKCNEVQIDGTCHNVCKTPVTDLGKASKAGKQALIKHKGTFMSYPAKALSKDDTDYLELVYHNGKLMREQTFDEIRELARNG